MKQDDEAPTNEQQPDANPADESRRAFIGTTAALGFGLTSLAPVANASAVTGVPSPQSSAPVGEGIRLAHGVPAGEISPAKFNIRHEYDVLSPMRDGAKLAMDIHRPDAPGAFPVILTRTPYDKVGTKKSAFAAELVRRGYVVAAQDTRGRFNSDGDFDPYRQDHNDGFDTVEWIADQSWCDGNVGMIGGSYVGQTQWFAASQAPEALKAIVPTVSPPGHPYVNEPFYGGAMILAMPEWMIWMGRRSFHPPGPEGILSSHLEAFEALPLSKFEDISGTSSPWWQRWLEHPEFDEFWAACGYDQFWSNMRVPALNITGWWDMNFLGAPRNFMGMRENAATADAREGQRLVIGPWPHGVNRTRELNGVDFGPEAITGLDAYTIQFFDRWLRGKTANRLDNEARVHVFVLGANQWWEADHWPLPGTSKKPLYLHSGGQANSHRGDGTVSFRKPGDEPHDSYDSDPLDPVRTIWRLADGPVDDQWLTARHDILCYTSEALTEALNVVGMIKAVLYASSSARDCDWHMRMVDVHPDGAARFLCHGVLRSRFRQGFDRTVLLEPDEITRFDIDMTAAGVRFLPGHRIRIEISSSWFSRFDRNPQTGGKNLMTDTATPIVARQRVHHSRQHPSHIMLPVIENAPDQGAQDF